MRIADYWRWIHLSYAVFAERRPHEPLTATIRTRDEASPATGFSRTVVGQAATVDRSMHARCHAAAQRMWSESTAEGEAARVKSPTSVEPLRGFVGDVRFDDRFDAVLLFGPGEKVAGQ